ncbi:MAG: sterol desaturase family protein [Bacteroidota bacterium]
MQTYADALMIAIPGFMLLILVEAIYGHFKGKQTIRSLDTISSLSSGITNTIKDSLKLVVVILSYPVLLSWLGLWEMEATWQAYVLGFIAIDFAGYWSHRLAHSVNLFWNRHAIHHSSEEFNLPCALRQSISNLLGIYAFFLIPAALLGVPAKVITLLAPLHLFLQFWYHTRHIPKLGWLEYLIITPSQHRVHHAINPIYLDKNLGQIFSIWDRLFGTFQEELEEEPPVYGITRPMATWNPFKINFKHIWLLARDAWRTKSWKDKFRIWFMPTGWRPEDVSEAYPVYKIEDVHQFDKYAEGEDSRPLVVWSWFQLVATTFLLIFMLSQFSKIGETGLLICGGIIALGIYGYTALMDRDPAAVWVEAIRGLIGVSWIVYSGDWFGMAGLWEPGLWLVGGYFVLSALGAIWLSQQESVPAPEAVQSS